MNLIINYVAGLRSQTELLEALNWDDELMEQFIEELGHMLRAAPPNVDKALFWLQNTPWDCFDGGALPPNVFNVVKKNFKVAEEQLKQEQEAHRKKLYALPSINRKTDDTEWN